MTSLVGTIDSLSGQIISEDIDLNQGGSGACAPTIATVDLGSWPSLTYHIGAVHLDGSTYLQSAASLAADSGKGVLSFWVYGPYSDTHNCIFSLLPRSSYQLGFSCTNLMTVDRGAITSTKEATNWNSNEGLWDSSKNYSFPGGASFDPTSAWTHVLYSWDNDTLGITQTCINGILQSNSTSPHLFPLKLSWGPWQFFSDLSNGVSAVQAESGGGFDPYTAGDPDFGADGNAIADVADIWFDPGTFLDLTVSSNVAKFYNSGPVDLGANGQNPTLSSPLIFFHIDVSEVDANNFATNRGTGAGFSRSGSFTLASTHP